jgi:hypothetical protein
VFLAGQETKSQRDGFIYWNGAKMYGVKWQNFKLVLVEQKYLTDPALPLSNPHIVNLVTDPKEREPFNPVFLHSWTMAHFWASARAARNWIPGSVRRRLHCLEWQCLGGVDGVLARLKLFRGTTDEF